MAEGPRALLVASPGMVRFMGAWISVYGSLVRGSSNFG
jgi:hypothetical protein